MKKLFIILLLIISLPVFAAGEFNDAYSSGKNVLVYFYSPTCISCEKFNPIYFELEKKYKDIRFVRINIDTREGEHLMRKFHGIYIPYLILTSSKNKKTISVSSSCAMNEMCLTRVLKSFNN